VPWYKKSSWNGQEFRAPIIVSNADLKKTYLELIGAEHLPNGLVKKANNFVMSAPFVNVYLGVDIDLSQHIPNTNYFSMPTNNNLADVHNVMIDHPYDLSRDEWLKLVKKEMPAFVHCGSMKDPDNPRHAPKGCSSLEAMCLMPRGRQFWTSAKAGEKYSRDPQYIDLKEQLTELMIQRTEAVIPAIKGKILWKEASTPLTQGHYTYSTDDTAYGLECNIKQFGPFRPRSRTLVKGLFICGTSTAWGPSIEGSVISGMQAAAAVLDRDLDAEIRSGKIYADPSILTSGGTGWDPLKATSNLNKRAKVVNVDEGCDRH
jgi:all-trans-retinol 13,14-reductase